MKKTLFSLFIVIAGYGATHAQTITIKNQTCFDIIFYSGNVNVNGAPYSFGSEFPSPAIQPAFSDSTYYLGSSLPGGPVPAPTGTVVFTGFKYRIDGPGPGSGYVASTAPYNYSPSGPTDPSGCNGGNPITAVWIGMSSNPIVYFLP